MFVFEKTLNLCKNIFRGRKKVVRANTTGSWLAGCWQSTLDEPGSGEQWMAPAGGSMLGMARTLKGGRMVQFEFMQLRESVTGLSLIAQPGGRQPSVFIAKEASTEAAVFERQSAEFPQRVAYRLRPDGGLAARIEGDAKVADVPMSIRMVEPVDKEAGVNRERVVTAKLEPSLASATPADRFQFERLGYFVVDPIDSRPDAPVFNRVTTLKDTWAAAS